MELFSEAYMRCAQTYWGEYISEKKQLPGEKPPSRSVIWDSWKRSLKYGVDCRP